MAKVAVSSQGKSLESQVDPRFGRAAYFVLVDPKSMEFSVLDNSAARQMGRRAGAQAAKSLARAGAETVISGILGPKALQALAAAGVQVVQQAVGTVAEAVEGFSRGQGVEKPQS